MKIYRSGSMIEEAEPCIALGNFDGMHKGHMSIFSEAASAKSFGALLFEKNTKTERQITPLEEKIDIMQRMGADFVYVVRFDEKFKSMELEEFADFLEKIGVKRVCVGYDYRCAKNAAADTQALTKELFRRKIGITVCEPVADNGVPIKSSRLREMITQGEIEAANALMCEPYRICGEVISGYKRGRGMGFATANIEYARDKLLPADGVYRAESTVDAKKYAVVLNIGKNPTFDLAERSVEAHLLDFDGDLYGKNISLEIKERIRGEIRFKNADELKMQITEDVRYVKEKENED